MFSPGVLTVPAVQFGYFADVSHELHLFTSYLCDIAISIMELLSIGIILFTTLIAFTRLFKKSGQSYARVYLLHGQSVGLTFKLGAEILKTVNASSMDEIWQIVMLVIIKAMMILLIDWELNGTHETEVQEARIAQGADSSEGGFTRMVKSRIKNTAGLHGHAVKEHISNQEEQIASLKAQLEKLEQEKEASELRQG